MKRDTSQKKRATRAKSEPKEGVVVSLWLTRKEVCQKLGCSTRTLTRLVSEGRVERRQSGREGRYRVLQSEPREPREPQSETRATVTKHKLNVGSGLVPIWERLADAERARGRLEGQLSAWIERSCRLEALAKQQGQHMVSLQDLVDVQDNCIKQLMETVSLLEHKLELGER